ncbi:VOC family protein [Paenarthrobacter nitroguajacolicus]|uniref:VOC family protein n=1 Tax=Paenarthrobacter nitroguajacolicus TaxID=211146 RepID=UPI00248D210C|nr:VOC family protein [Paenarthrobacter nitroguajacolicus]MDI2036568.1 putative glyoxylase CFP32 [Paenarthrobacter nitroguajacolicus]
MSTKISAWPPATPMWVDLGVDDLDAAMAFYSDLFDWTFHPGGPESGGYVLAELRGRAVAGLGPKQDPGMPNTWTTYLASDDVDATARKVAASGGQLIAPPFDVMDSGRMAVVLDSTGAVFGIWQAGNHIGAERVNEHGALCWNELHTRDHAATASFYADVFDVSFQDINDDNHVYSTIRRPLDGREVGGVLHDAEASINDHWMTWFASDHVHSTALRAVELGATLVRPVAESPLGRTAIVRAPQGETFGIIDAPRTSDR